MKIFLTRSNHCILNFKFLITLLFSLLLITSCYKDEEDDGVLRQLSIDNVEKLATRNQEIYQFSDSILRVYRSLQQQSPYNEQSFTLFLDAHRGTSIHIMDSLVYLLDSINANALHRYRLNKEAYDYAKRTSNLPKGYILDTKFTLDSLDALDLKLKKLISSTLPNIKKQATDFSDKIYRRLSLWYLELQQYLTKAKSAHALFAETITPQKYNDKIFEESTSKKSVYEFLLPFERDSIKSVSRIEAEMFVVDFYLRNKSFPLGQDTTSLIPLSKFERLTTQADNFMAVVKACPTFLQIEKHNTEGKPMAKQLEEDSTFINNNFPNLLLDGKKAVKVIEETRQLFTTDTTSNAKTKKALRDSIMRANTIRFIRSVNIATITSLPNDYAESKLKVLSDLQLKVKEQIMKEIEQSKEWIRERGIVLQELISTEEKLRDKIISDNYNAQGSTLISTSQNISFNDFKIKVLLQLKNNITHYKKIKKGIDDYIDLGTFSDGFTLNMIPSLSGLEEYKNIYKGIDLTMQMAYLIDSCTNAKRVVLDNIERLSGANLENKQRELLQLEITLSNYIKSLRSGIDKYYSNCKFLYTEPHFILSQFNAIRESIAKSYTPENTVIAFDPKSALEESTNKRKFNYNVSTLSNGKKEMLAVNKGEYTGADEYLNFLSIPLSHLPEVVNLGNTCQSAIQQLENKIEVEVLTNDGDLCRNQYVICINMPLDDGKQLQIPLFPKINRTSDHCNNNDNIYEFVPIDEIESSFYTPNNIATRDWPWLQGTPNGYGKDAVLAALATTTPPLANFTSVRVVVYYNGYSDNLKHVQSIKIRGIFN